MKKQILLLLGCLNLTLPTFANYEACKIDLSKKFGVSEAKSGLLCALDSEFIQTCMNEQSEARLTTDFQILSEICIDHHATSQSKQSPF
jgi:hypothetical protein